MQESSLAVAFRTVAELGPYLAVENAVIFQLKLLLQNDLEKVRVFAVWYCALNSNPAHIKIRVRILTSTPVWELVDKSLVDEICELYRNRLDTN